MLGLGACATNPSPPISLALPTAPAQFGTRVAAPRIKIGEDARSALAHEREALSIANRRLTNDGAFYDDVRSRLGQ
jgi:hypothetical protein